MVYNLISHKQGKLDLKVTLDSGQAFRYFTPDINLHPNIIRECEDNIGVRPLPATQYIFAVSSGRNCCIAIQLQDGCIILICEAEQEQFWIDYFRLGEEITPFEQEYSLIQCKSDEYLYNIIEQCGKGLCILKQDLLEVLISFIISQNNNISRIKKIMTEICLTGGEYEEILGVKIPKLPTVEQLLIIFNNSEQGTGYRHAYLKGLCQSIVDNPKYIEVLQKSTYDNAMSILITFNGIGNKVANCICLFGLNKSEAFPIDVWIERAIKRINLETGLELHTLRKKYAYCLGYIQQCLFIWIRGQT